MNILELAQQTKALAKKATPGPWEKMCLFGSSDLPVEIVSHENEEKRLVLSEESTFSVLDVDFIAHSRTAAPQLADVVIEMVEFLHVVGCIDQPDRIYAGDSHAFYLKKARELLQKLGITTDRCKHEVHGKDCFECYPKESGE